MCRSKPRTARRFGWPRTKAKSCSSISGRAGACRARRRFPPSTRSIANIEPRGLDGAGGERRRASQGRRPFLAAHPHVMPVFFDPKGDSPKAFKVEGMPTLFSDRPRRRHPVHAHGVFRRRRPTIPSGNQSTSVGALTAMNHHISRLAIGPRRADHRALLDRRRLRHGAALAARPAGAIRRCSSMRTAAWSPT